MDKTFNQMYEEYENKVIKDYRVMCFNDTTVMFSEFQIRILQIMKHLVRLGVREKSGVGYTLKNSLDIIPLFIAISRIGAYAFPIFNGIPAQKRMESYEKAKVSLIITNEDNVEALRTVADATGYTGAFAVVEKSDNDSSIYGDCELEIDLEQYKADSKKQDLPLMVGASSGTTGNPKMVVMSQRNVGSEMIVAADMESSMPYQMGECVQSMAFPFSTSVMLVLCGILFYGATIVYTDDMSPMNFLRYVEKYKSKRIVCPPAYLESLLLWNEKNPYDVSSINTIGGGMDFFSTSLLKRLRNMFPNFNHFYGGYGLVETSNIYMYTTSQFEGDEIKDTAKFKLSENAENFIKVCDRDGNEVAAGETGEVYVKGANVITGYMSSPTEVMEAFADGWLKTGDIAEKINDRTINLMGRKKYFIKRGGKSVSPIVVQTEINKTEGIVDSGVVGVPHPLFGEMIWAFVVKAPDSFVSLKEIKKTCKQMLPYYMLPDQVTFLESIPKRSGVGKVDFEQLRKMAKEELNQRTS